MSDIEAVLRDVIEQFSKQELMQIRDELGLTVVGATMVLARSIISDLDQNGVPDPKTQLFKDFLVAAEYTDDDGNLIGFDGSTEDGAEPATEDLPKCFGFHSPIDPACQRCPVKPRCQEYLMAHLPSCFGVYFDKTNVDCQGCLVASLCKQTLQSK